MCAYVHRDTLMRVNTPAALTEPGVSISAPAAVSGSLILSSVTLVSYNVFILMTTGLEQAWKSLEL